MKQEKNYLIDEGEQLSIVNEALLGVYASVVDDIVEISGYEKMQLEKIMNTSFKTYDRYKKEKKRLNPEQSERVLKLQALFQLGNKVFGNKELLSVWMGKPSFGLGNIVPNEAIKTTTGVDLVMNELTNIAFGNLA